MPPRAVAADDHAVDLERTTEQLGGRFHLPRFHVRTDARRRHAGDERDLTRVETERPQELAVSFPTATEAEAFTGDDDLGADHSKDVGANASGESSAVSGVNSTTRTSSIPHVSSSSRRRPSVHKQLDAVAECRPRVRIERDHGRAKARVDRSADHRAMAGVDAVERPDRDRARQRFELVRLTGDVHDCASSASTPSRIPVSTRSSAASGKRPSASPADISRASSTGTASSTSNGPTAVRRRVVQWPAERVRDRPHVGARTDVQRQLHRRGCCGIAAIGDDVEREDLRTPQGHLHVDTPPCQLVRALAADLHRRGGRDRQLDLTAEALERRIDRRAVRRRMPAEDVAFRIARRGRRGQVDVGDVSLVQADKARSKPSCRTGQQDQKPRGERVQCPRVTGPRTRPAAERRDDREGRGTCRLVDQRDPDRPHEPSGSALP